MGIAQVAIAVHILTAIMIGRYNCTLGAIEHFHNDNPMLQLLYPYGFLQLVVNRISITNVTAEIEGRVQW